jgi:deazaflavin-dependent oxidoreductase (nitroreductase family)
VLLPGELTAAALAEPASHPWHRPSSIGTVNVDSLPSSASPGAGGHAMPIPQAITRFNRRALNPFTLRLAGHGSMADLEHVGRTSGTVRHTPLMAFRHGETVTIALTYGPNVQWLENITAAGHCRMRLGGDLFDLGAPRRLDPAEGLARMPNPQRVLLRWPIRCHDYVELPVLATASR